MEQSTSYCTLVRQMENNSLHHYYHDNVYGFPVDSDNELFERLTLEINQAGLNWAIILQKQENFKKAFDNFNIEKVAQYKEKERQRLLNDAGIIRNRMKVDAAIYNANAIVELQKEHGSFRNWLDNHHPLPLEEWVELFNKQFKFTGKEIVNEFLISTGYLQGAHINICPIYKQIIEVNPPWLQAFQGR